MFTDKQLKGLQPKAKKYTVTEATGERGESRLQLNVYPTGAKKFQIQYYLSGKRKRFEFGKFGNMPGDISLQKARIKFGELAGQVKNNIDPKGGEPVTSEQLASLQKLQQLYLDWYKANRKTNSFNTVKGFIESYTDFASATKQARDFTADNARELIYPVWNRGKKDAALGLKSALSKMFKWGIDYDKGPARFGKPPVFGITENPIRDINLTLSKTAGARWLKEEEIAKIWNDNSLPRALSRYIRLQLALAGQRIEEVCRAHKNEFDLTDNLLTIPAERVKVTKRGDHIVPLGELAQSVYKECLKFRSRSGLLFYGARNPLEPIPVMTLRNQLRAYLKIRPEMEPFTLRDIRRTCKTHMSKAGVPIDHRDMLQQHYKSDVATIHYDRYDYLAEKRQAIEIWNEYLQTIITKKSL